MSRDKKDPTASAFEAESGAKPVIPAPAVRAGVSEWKARKFPESVSGRQHPDLWKHAAASTLHRWRLYAHDYGRDFEISESDYDAALAAASEHGPGGSYMPHAAALYGER